MRLNEEYLQRHKISVPIIRHVPLGYLIVRDSSETCFDFSTVSWTVLAIRWQDQIIHPGFYKFQFFRPQKATSPDSDCLKQYDKDIELRWDEYESFIWEWSSKIDPATIINDPMEVVMTMWEMFVYSHEIYIADRYRNLSNLLFQSLDFTSGLSARYNSYSRFLKLVDGHESPFNSWSKKLSEVTKNYSSWLAKLHA
jgi:hypothetical protein